ARATGLRQGVEGHAVHAVAGRADLLVDLEAVLQIGAVEHAERTLKRPALRRRVERQRIAVGGEGRRGEHQTEGETKRECKAHGCPHSAGAGTEPSTDLAMESGSGLGVSIRPMTGMSTQKKP